MVAACSLSRTPRKAASNGLAVAMTSPRTETNKSLRPIRIGAPPLRTRPQTEHYDHLTVAWLRGSDASSKPLDLAPAFALWFPGPGGFMPGGPREAGILGGRHLPGRGSLTHILMIEDDPSIADIYRGQLQNDGYRVTIATTAELGVTTMTANPPDIVLLDLLLPDRSGFEVLAALNERFPSHPPVVILSNYGEPAMIDRGRSLGAVEYLVKSRVTPADISGQIPTC